MGLGLEQVHGRGRVPPHLMMVVRPIPQQSSVPVLRSRQGPVGMTFALVPFALILPANRFTPFRDVISVITAFGRHHRTVRLLRA